MADAPFTFGASLRNVKHDGLTLTPFVNGYFKAIVPKYETLYCGLMARFLAVDRFPPHRDTSLPKELFIVPRFTTVDLGPVLMEIRGYTYQLCGAAPTDLRIQVPSPIITFDGLSRPFTKTHLKAAIQYRLHIGRDARQLEN
jgi:hypothetical protein